MSLSTTTSAALPAKNNLVTRFQLQVKGSSTPLSGVVILQQVGDTVDLVVDVAPVTAAVALRNGTEAARPVLRQDHRGRAGGAPGARAPGDRGGAGELSRPYSTVTDFARLRGWSTS